jgi:HlyD family secretion protein
LIQRSFARSVVGAVCLLPLVACFGRGEQVRLAGTVERTTIELALPVSETLLERAAQPGQRVERGQTLLRFDATVAQAEVDAAQAELRATDAGLAEARAEFARAEGLRAARVVAAADFGRARARLDVAEGEAAARRAALAAAGKKLADLTVQAPAAGVVDELPFDPGERVPAGSIVAVLVVDDPPWVRVWLPAPAAARVALGARAAVEVDGLAAPLQGRLVEVARAPAYTPHFALTEREGAHLVYPARVLIENAPAGLRPGLPARVILTAAAGAPPAPG